MTKGGLPEFPTNSSYEPHRTEQRGRIFEEAQKKLKMNRVQANKQSYLISSPRVRLEGRHDIYARWTCVPEGVDQRVFYEPQVSGAVAYRGVLFWQPMRTFPNIEAILLAGSNFGTVLLVFFNLGTVLLVGSKLNSCGNSNSNACCTEQPD